MSFTCVGCDKEKDEYGFKLPNGLLICDECFSAIELPTLDIAESTRHTDFAVTNISDDWAIVHRVVLVDNEPPIILSSKAYGEK